MRLAAAVGQFQLAYRFIVLPRQAKHHVFRKFAQVKGGIGKREEIIRVLVDGARFAHHHIVEVCRKDRKR